MSEITLPKSPSPAKQACNNIVLLTRAKPLHRKASVALLESNFLFRHMQATATFSDRDAAKKHFNAASKMQKKS